ncbi:MAG: prevent-host-death protein [Bacteroidota bacterium]
MKTISASELKANFSAVLKGVIAGEEIGITYGPKKEIVAKLVPMPTEQKPRRTIGILEGKGKVKFAKDFRVTEDAFLRL